MHGTLAEMTKTYCTYPDLFSSPPSFSHLEVCKKGVVNLWKLGSFSQGGSSIGLVFMNPTSQLKRTDTKGFCMQLGNSEEGNNISEREGVTLV